MGRSSAEHLQSFALGSHTRLWSWSCPRLQRTQRGVVRLAVSRCPLHHVYHLKFASLEEDVAHDREAEIDDAVEVTLAAVRPQHLLTRLLTKEFLLYFHKFV